jgi:hypothetical protein
MLGEQFALIKVRIAGKNESPNPHINVALQFFVNLIWITYDGAAAA